MSITTRRGFVAQSAVLASLVKPLFSDPLNDGDLGVQLYTVRDVIKKDPATTIKAIENIGYKEVEATDYEKNDPVWKALTGSSLKLVSIHVSSASFTKPDELKAKFADFKKRGFQYVVYPYVPVPERGGADVYKRLGATLNQAGQQAKADGLTLCYHNHAFEFGKVGDTTPLQIILSETQPDTLGLELDMFWVSVAGHDPVALLKQYSGRVPLLHLKDKAKGVPVQYNEKVPESAFKEDGSGSIDIPAVLTAANTAGVKNYFVEQDHTPGDPVDSLRQSYKYLSKQFKS